MVPLKRCQLRKKSQPQLQERVPVPASPILILLVCALVLLPQALQQVLSVRVIGTLVHALWLWPPFDRSQLLAVRGWFGRHATSRTTSRCCCCCWQRDCCRCLCRHSRVYLGAGQKDSGEQKPRDVAHPLVLPPPVQAAVSSLASPMVVSSHTAGRPAQQTQLVVVVTPAQAKTRLRSGSLSSLVVNGRLRKMTLLAGRSRKKKKK